MFCESLLFVGCDDVKLSEAVVLSDVVRAIHVDGAVLHQPAQCCELEVERSLLACWKLVLL